MPVALSNEVRKTGFIVRYAASALPELLPALARLDAVVFMRTSCADIARPATRKIVIGPDILFALQRAGDRADPPLQEGQRRLVLHRVLGEGGLFLVQLDRVAIHRSLVG